MTTSPSLDTQVLTAPPDDESTVITAPVSQPALPASADTSTASVEAQERREEAWRSRNDWTFLGKPLEAWTMERESLLALLTEADVPGPKLSAISYYENRLAAAREAAEKNGTLAEIQHITLENLVDVMELYPTAAKLLFLASHKPEAWDHLRGRDRLGRFLRAIADWAEVNIPAADLWPAILLARDISAKYDLVRAQRRPYHTLRTQLGN